MRSEELYNGKKLWMPDMVREGIERGGDSTFAIYRHSDGSIENVSYNTIKEEGEALIRKLLDAGVVKGDRLFVICAMRPLWYSVLYAALMGGFRMVCVDPGIPPEQVRTMMEETECRAVITTLSSVRLPDTLDGRIPVYSVDCGFPLLPPPPLGASGGERGLIAMQPCDRVDILLPSASELPEETFFILFSSGTTGERRKGVLLPHTTVTLAIEYGMSTDAGIYKNTAAYTVRERDLMLFPPYHIAGLLCAVYDIYNNTEIIMLERLLPNAIQAVFSELKPDNICTVPSMLTMLMKKIRAGVSGNIFAKALVSTLLSVCGFLRRYTGLNPGRYLLGFLNKKAFGGNLRGFMIGGSPCDAATMKFFLDMGMDVSLAYGLTELGAPLAVTGRGYYPGTTGRVLRHTELMDIRCVDPDEKGRGEIQILSPYRMIRYLHEEDMKDSFTWDGYFRSGDLGYFDDRDCLVISGRSKESIVFSNGEKLLPEEIEALYDGIEKIGELSVFKVPEGPGCDAFCIAAVKDKDCGIPDEAIRQRILDKSATLPVLYRPREVYILKNLPYSSSHKVQRFRLTDMALKGETRPVTETSMRKIDEDDITRVLRECLIQVSGSRWDDCVLTEGTLLELDSLKLMELYAAIEEKTGKNLFSLDILPETFGELSDALRSYDILEKKKESTVDLRQYPLPVSAADRILYGTVRKAVSRYYNVHAEGLENIPLEGNYIICSNHETVLDPAWIVDPLPPEVRDRTVIIGKIELADDRLLKGFVRSQHYVPVDRNGNITRTLDRCRELLNEGWNVLIFPEGTDYQNDKEMLPFKEGAVRLALACGKPLVPVYISGAGKIDINNATFLPPRSSRVDVCFGKPVLPGEKEPADLNSELRAAIWALRK